MFISGKRVKCKIFVATAVYHNDHMGVSSWHSQFVSSRLGLAYDELYEEAGHLTKFQKEAFKRKHSFRRNISTE